MTERVHDLQAVISNRRDESEPESPVVTLTARVSLGSVGEVRLLVRPVVAMLADASGPAPRTEFHAEGGSSVILEGAPLAALFADSVKFLRHRENGSACEHDHIFGLESVFDLAMGPFATLEQPPFLVASARTFVHESGGVALRLLGETRPVQRDPHHAPVRVDGAEREAFDLQIQARQADWLAGMLENALVELGGAPVVDVGKGTTVRADEPSDEKA